MDLLVCLIVSFAFDCFVGNLYLFGLFRHGWCFISTLLTGLFVFDLVGIWLICFVLVCYCGCDFGFELIALFWFCCVTVVFLMIDCGLMYLLVIWAWGLCLLCVCYACLFCRLSVVCVVVAIVLWWLDFDFGWYLDCSCLCDM